MITDGKVYKIKDSYCFMGILEDNGIQPMDRFSVKILAGQVDKRRRNFPMNDDKRLKNYRSAIKKIVNVDLSYGSDTRERIERVYGQTGVDFFEGVQSIYRNHGNPSVSNILYNEFRKLLDEELYHLSLDPDKMVSGF